MAGHRLLKLGGREDGSGANRCGNWEPMQSHQVLIHSVRCVIKICFQTWFSQWTVTFKIDWAEMSMLKREGRAQAVCRCPWIMSETFQLWSILFFRYVKHRHLYFMWLRLSDAPYCLFEYGTSVFMISFFFFVLSTVGPFVFWPIP